MRRIPVAVLGATGTVGQALITRLAPHPWFRITELAAGADRAGQRLAETGSWRMSAEIPAGVAALRLLPPDQLGAPVCFSALTASAAAIIEPALARRGSLVLSNASAHRMSADVPLIIPEVNAPHLGLLATQRDARGWAGALVTNPNCVVAALALALAPLHQAFTLDRLVVTTMQAASGAGYPGVASLDLLGNVLPYIDGEEEKIARELARILGRLEGDAVVATDIQVAVHANRVPTVDGHLMTVSAGFRTPVSVDDARAAMAAWKGSAAARALPSTPDPALRLIDEPSRPQPRLDAQAGHGMTVSVGRLRRCPVLDLRCVVLGHNLARGAAGATVQLGELAVARGAVPRCPLDTVSSVPQRTGSRQGDEA